MHAGAWEALSSVNKLWILNRYTLLIYSAVAAARGECLNHTVSLWVTQMTSWVPREGLCAIKGYVKKKWGHLSRGNFSIYFGSFSPVRRL